MKQRFAAALTALVFAAATLAPGVASADHRRDGYYGHRGGGYYDDRYYGRRHHDDDDGEAVAAGVIGLVLGLALGAAATSEQRSPRYANRSYCYDNYQRCAPPPSGYYNQGQSYYNQGYNQGYYDPRHAPDYGLAGGPYADPYYAQRPSCVRTERQWDRYANRYVNVEVPC